MYKQYVKWLSNFIVCIKIKHKNLYNQLLQVVEKHKILNYHKQLIDYNNK